MLFIILFAIFWLPIRIFYPTKVIGKKNLLKKQGFVFACNHYSNLDPIILDVVLKKKLRFLAKKELFNNRVLGYFLQRFGAFPVDRGKPEISTFKFALNVLKENKVLAIFPEGTRNKTGSEDLQELKRGAVIFAGKGGVPIVPSVFYKKSSFLRKNYLLIGEPIYLEAENPKKMTSEEIEKNTQILAESMKKLKEDFELNRKSKRKNKYATEQRAGAGGRAKKR